MTEEEVLDAVTDIVHLGDEDELGSMCNIGQCGCSGRVISPEKLAAFLAKHLPKEQ